MCNELLNVDTETVERFYDPGIQGWMEDPDSGRSRLVDVLPNASRVIGTLFSMGYYLGKLMTLYSFASHGMVDNVSLRSSDTTK